MYKIKKARRRKKDSKYIKEFSSLPGFLMPTKKKIIKINDLEVSNIRIADKKLANPLVSKKVNKIYKKLIVVLTELLVSDEESGDVYREVLNQIEKFRQEIKNKYRIYLEKKDLEVMSRQLKILQYEAKNKFIESQISYNNMIGKSR